MAPNPERDRGPRPGRAFMIETGLPADGSQATTPEELARRGAPVASTQYLVNPPTEVPIRSEPVLRWVRERAARELGRAE
jgi:hypothetical protein